MRAFERFLVAFAAISLLMRILGMRDAPSMELIAITLLAIFYLTTFPILLRPADGRRGGWHWVLAFASGAGLAYSLISMLCYTLGWVTKMDMLVNVTLISALLVGGGLWGKRKGHLVWMEIFWRAAILWVVMVIISIWKLPALGALSHGS
jgi:hypothetical protein